MSENLEEQIRQLRSVIFEMLNFTNIYVLVLDEKMRVKFANNSLAVDLGFKSYKELINKCWLEFITDGDKTSITTIHDYVSNGRKGWEEKYRECYNDIMGENKKIRSVYWFNSHINTDYNWTFSFGIKKQQPPEESIDSVRSYYKELITKDRVMINSMRDVVGLRDKIVDTCKPDFVESSNADSLSIQND